MSLLIKMLALVSLSSGMCRLAAEEWSFQVRIDEEIFSKNYSGRVYVFFSKTGSEPRTGPDWFHPEPFLALDVVNWEPGKSILISTNNPQVLRFPKTFAEVDLSGMMSQAVVRFNPLERKVGTGIGNGFSETLRLGDEHQVRLPITQRVAGKPTPDLGNSQVVSLPSKLLSDFHGRPVLLNATVTLPAGYQEQLEQRYPVIYEVPGFGGTHLDARQLKRHQQPRLNSLGVDFIKVLLDPSCPLGHHVFANSANNGPHADALVQELIPQIDQQFRTVPHERGRFVSGHSSGGWSSLWLQVNFPQTFGGTWSTSPDPVDFRDFQRIDLYRTGENMYVDREGKRRPLARMNGQVVLWYDDFDHMEHVLGFGGQLHSFEAVFSPRAKDGTPRRLWNRATGEIDPVVAQAWKSYDINLILRARWKELEPHLRGKLHVIMGDQDTFYLEGASILLEQTLTELQSDAQVTILPGRDHFNLFAGGLAQQIEQEIAQRFLDSQLVEN